MPNAKRRSPKPSHPPAKTIDIAPKTVLDAPIYPHVPPNRPTQTIRNERK